MSWSLCQMLNLFLSLFMIPLRHNRPTAPEYKVFADIEDPENKHTSGFTDFYLLIYDYCIGAEIYP